MAKIKKSPESRVIEACTYAKAQAKPNLARISRDFHISYDVLRNRMKGRTGPANSPKLANRLLQPHQEEEVLSRVSDMRALNIPITQTMVKDWANDALARSGSDRKVGKMWADRFERRLPEHLHFIPRLRARGAVEVEAVEAESPVPVSPPEDPVEPPPKKDELLSQNQQRILRSLDQLDSMIDARLEQSILAEKNHHRVVKQEIATLREQMAAMESAIERLNEV